MNVADFGERRALPFSGVPDDSQGFWRSCSRDDRNSRFDDARLFRRDLRQGVAEPWLMIELHIRDHAGQGHDNVGGVEAPAQARFPDDEIALFLHEMSERQHGDDFKKCRGPVARKRFQQRAQFRRQANEVGGREGPAIDLDAFAEGHKMRRGVEAHAQTGRAIHVFEHGTSGSLAVGPGDVDEAQAVLRIAGQRSQPSGSVETEMRAEHLQGLQELDGVSVSHGDDAAAAVRARKVFSRAPSCPLWRRSSSRDPTATSRP